jgi:hypothetical protein
MSAQRKLRRTKLKKKYGTKNFSITWGKYMTMVREERLEKRELSKEEKRIRKVYNTKMRKADNQMKVRSAKSWFDKKMLKLNKKLAKANRKVAV